MQINRHSNELGGVVVNLSGVIARMNVCLKGLSEIFVLPSTPFCEVVAMGTARGIPGQVSLLSRPSLVLKCAGRLEIRHEKLCSNNDRRLRGQVMMHSSPVPCYPTQATRIVFPYLIPRDLPAFQGSTITNTRIAQEIPRAVKQEEEPPAVRKHADK